VNISSCLFEHVPIFLKIAVTNLVLRMDVGLWVAMPYGLVGKRFGGT
jgi:hypothetical protein